MTKSESCPSLNREVEFLQAVREAVAKLGGSAGYFMVRAQDCVKDLHHILMACDPRWGCEYESLECYGNDPWLRYAARNSAPCWAANIPCLSSSERTTVDLAKRFGFDEALIFPAPSPQGRTRVALLVIGSRDPDFCKRMESASYRAEARDLSMALHEDWTDKLRGDLAASCALSKLDLQILELELRGSRTKEMAKTLGTTCTSINSRVQRLNNKLQVTDRRSAELRALEFGLISAPERETRRLRTAQAHR
jgi:hypothetical protein